jgi:hypothetical protein
MGVDSVIVIGYGFLIPTETWNSYKRKQLKKIQYYLDPNILDFDTEIEGATCNWHLYSDSYSENT